jgi:hypothetical protein
MVVEEDDGMQPKITIQPTKIPDPEAPPGSCMKSPQHIKQGALALFRSSLDRTALPQKTLTPFDKTALRTAYHVREGIPWHQVQSVTNSVSNKSKFTLSMTNPFDVTGDHHQMTYNMFSKVDSKFKRELEPVKIERMLSRDDHKTLYGLE